MEGERIVVTSGHPTDVELAAVTAALARHRPAEASTTRRPSRWVRAARLEGCGHPPIESPKGFTRWVPSG